MWRRIYLIGGLIVVQLVICFSVVPNNLSKDSQNTVDIDSIYRTRRQLVESLLAESAPAESPQDRFRPDSADCENRRAYLLQDLDYIGERRCFRSFWQEFFARKPDAEIVVSVECRSGGFHRYLIVFRSKKDYYLATCSLHLEECRKEPKLKVLKLDGVRVKDLVDHYEVSNKIFERHSTFNCCSGFLISPHPVFFIDVSYGGRSNSFFIYYVKCPWPEKFEDMFNFLDSVDTDLKPCPKVDSLGTDSE
jgi:hypothetical protein